MDLSLFIIRLTSSDLILDKTVDKIGFEGGCGEIVGFAVF